ncbi:MAG: T9SS type A sorting domain-containing protein, partial [Lewinella sp.]|nr:T9SS type A sorting domain-containing protein [Lewinella sp.]
SGQYGVPVSIGQVSLPLAIEIRDNNEPGCSMILNMVNDQLAAIGDYVWNDADNDGIQDANESGVANVTVNLKDATGAVIATTVTNNEGLYSFICLEPGTYSVQFVLPDGFQFTAANQGADDGKDSDAEPAMDGMTHTVTVAGGDTDLTLDAGIIPTGECDLNIVVSNVDCNDNGTPDNPDDDTYTFSVVITGGVGTGWTATDGSGYSGAYGQPVVVGPVAANQNTLISIRDNVENSCIAVIYVDATGPCVNTECAIDVTATGTDCQEDGSYILTVDISAVNSSIGFLISVNNGPSQVGVFPATMSFPIPAGQDATVKVTDLLDANCMTTLTVEAPDCTPCNISSAAAVNVTCDDNGTTDPSDDTYTFGLLVTNSGAGDNWKATLNGQTITGAYGTPIVLGPFNVQSTATLTITGIMDADNPDCTYPTDVTVTAPTTCSGCDIVSAEVTNNGCTENDGTFTFDLLVTGLNTSGVWVATSGSIVFTGSYGTPVTSPAIPGNGQLYTFTVTDAANPGCTQTFTVQAPNCECNLHVNIFDVLCNDNGTPDTDEDDTYTFTVVVTGGTGTGWTLENDPNFGGAYGEPVVFGPFPIDMTSDLDNYDNEIVDNGDNSCFAAIYVTAPDACSTNQCHLDAEIVQVTCSDNGTANPADDYFMVKVNVTSGGLASNGYMAMLEDGTILGAGFYPDMQTYGPFFGPVTIIFMDMMNDQCTDTLSVSFENCPAVCSIDAAVSNVVCNDNGTPALPDDDTFTFDVTVTNPTGSGSWTGGGTGGTYGTTVTVGPFPLSTVEFTISDAADATCSTTVTVNPPAPVIECPEDISQILNANGELVDLICTDVDSILNNPASLEWTGVPEVINGCGITGYTFEDELEAGGTCEAAVITRTFTFTAVTGETYTCQQHITFQSTAPVVDCPLSTHWCPILEENIMLFGTDPYECTATIELPLPDITGTCSDTWSVLMEVINAQGQILYTIQPGQPRTITGVGLGDYTIRYTVSDNCGHVTVKECIFRVSDLEEPTAVCIGGLNISLGGLGISRIYATNIDNGSYDNCAIASIEVRRLYVRDPLTCDSLATPYWSEWGPYVEVNCCDAGQYVTIEMRVTDVSGLTNICWMTVLVEDKTLPYCYGLANPVVSCDDLPAGFNPYDTIQLAQLFGSPDVIDNCSAYAIELAPVVDLDECGGGVIKRRFTAVDVVGNSSMAVYEQVITIDYTMNYEIRFPKDVVTDCVDNVDTLILNKVGCDSITWTCSDEYLPVEGDECLNILRTYHVINHCEWDGVSAPIVISRDEDCDGLAGEEGVWVLRRPDTTYIDRDSLEFNLFPAQGTKGTSCDGTTNPKGYWRQSASTGYWVYTQHIKIHDTTAPEVLFNTPQPFCSDSAACEGPVVYPFTVIEACGPKGVHVSVMIDLNADGTVDADLTNAGVLFGEFPYFEIRGDFPIGSHIFRVRVQDGCNNATLALLPFEVVDCFVPDPVCYSGLIVNLAPVPDGTDADGDGDIDEGAVTVFASELAACDATDCSEPLRFSVNRVGETPDINKTSITLTCDDRYSVQVEVYVWDSALNPYAIQPDGTVGGPNYKYCEATILVQDPDNLCSNCEENVMLMGGVSTTASKMVSGVNVALHGPAMDESMDTPDNGLYAFEDVNVGGPYTIRPAKDGDDHNGLSTIDLILLQRHLLGNQLLESPYLLIAADVNNSGNITTLDLIELRKLLLGNIDQFQNNTSWRFVPKSFVFPNQMNPWQTTFPEAITVQEVTSCIHDLDFVAIKIGDLNGSVVANALEGEVRNLDGDGMGLNVEDKLLTPGETYKIDFTADQLNRFEGFQFTLNFDNSALELLEVEHGFVQEEHIGTRYAEEGLLTFSWNKTAQHKGLNAGKAFSLVFRAKAAVRISELLSVSSRITQAEAYDNGLNAVPFNLTFSKQPIAANGFELLQNAPNPFRELTTIQFVIPEYGEVEFTIHDVTGKVVLRQNAGFAAGRHQLVVDADMLPAGVLYYTVTYKGQTATRKMVVIKS